MKFRAVHEGCLKGKGSCPAESQPRQMQKRRNSLDYMPGFVLPAIGEGKLAHFAPNPEVSGDERSFCRVRHCIDLDVDNQ